MALCYAREHAREVRACEDYYGKYFPVYSRVCDFTLEREEDCRNSFRVLYPGVDIWITLDTDEVIPRPDILTMLDVLKTGNYGVDICAMHILDYMTPDKVLKPQREHIPTVAVSKWVTFTDKRCCNRSKVYVLPGIIHHLYYLHESTRSENYRARGITGLEEMRGKQESINVPSDVREFQEMCL
jgi:hypothetical protein